jgi:hypothetical protein
MISFAVIVITARSQCTKLHVQFKCVLNSRLFSFYIYFLNHSIEYGIPLLVLYYFMYTSLFGLLFLLLLLLRACVCKCVFSFEGACWRIMGLAELAIKNQREITNSSS